MTPRAGVKCSFMVMLMVGIALFSSSCADGNPSYSEKFQQSISEGRVVIGMCPLEAKAAAGKIGRYQVITDNSNDQASRSPTAIINSQCSSPDDSIIILDFKNSTQFNSYQPIPFKVKFENGKAVLIQPY